MCTNEELQCIFTANRSELIREEFYKTHTAIVEADKEFVSEFGLKFNYPLNNDNYHVTLGLSANILHNMLESVASV